MNKFLRTAVAALLIGSTFGITTTASAQPGWQDRDRSRDHRGPDRVVVQKRVVKKRIVNNYDYNRPDPRYRGYYAERYYRGGNGYAPVRVTRQTRVYRGNDNRYYCRRSDGTTGLIVGAALGGVIGNQLDRGGSNLLGTLLGAGAGGLLGREVDRGGVSCR
jgi:hypothetical protein